MSRSSTNLFTKNDDGKSIKLEEEIYIWMKKRMIRFQEMYFGEHWKKT